MLSLGCMVSTMVLMLQPGFGVSGVVEPMPDEAVTIGLSCDGGTFNVPAFKFDGGAFTGAAMGCLPMDCSVVAQTASGRSASALISDRCTGSHFKCAGSCSHVEGVVLRLSDVE